MTWLELKTLLNKYFKDDEVIYPHAGFCHVAFSRVNHGQEFFMIEVEPGKTCLFEVKNGKKI